MGRKKRFKKRRIVTFVFTLETITTVKQALKLLRAQIDVHTSDGDDKVAFAAKTIQSVTTKLEGMEQSIGRLCLTSFDYNEKVILIQAIRMYVAYLFSTRESNGRSKELQRCYQLASYFAAKRLR